MRNFSNTNSGLEKIIESEKKILPINVNREISDIKPKKISYELFILGIIGDYAEFEMKYKINETQEIIEVKKDEKNKVVFENQNPIPGQDYSISITYNPARRGYEIKYSTTTYSERIEEARQNFALKLDKFLEIIPKSLMGGVLGYTYLGSGKIARRDDLFGDYAHMVDVHESIHTPDEYETRVITAWILSREPQKYKK